jgi:hypothetical protein
LVEKRGDVVYTPDWVAEDMVAHFEPRGHVLEPCAGGGAFLRAMKEVELVELAEVSWCEIEQGRDFFAWTEPVDWVVSNPPYSMTRPWFKHSYDIADNLLYLVPLRNVFSGYGFVKEIAEFGGIKEIRMYGTGGKLGFPMGNAVGAFHIVRGYEGQTSISFFEQIQRRVA